MTTKKFIGRTRSTTWRPIPELGDWPLDHTYVTTQEGDIWRCFGKVRPKAEELSATVVSEGSACFEWVQEISGMTASPAVAGVTHKVNGICQNASNRLLLPAGIDVRHAPGNEIATTIFGKYGLGLKAFANAVKKAAQAVNQRAPGLVTEEAVETAVSCITRSRDEELEILEEDLLEFLKVNTIKFSNGVEEQLIQIYSTLYEARHAAYAEFEQKHDAVAYKSAIRRNVIDTLQNVKSVVGQAAFHSLFRMPPEIAALRVLGPED